MTQTKPRYRLGIQWHLDNAKDDATKIPFGTVFKVTAARYQSARLKDGTFVTRSPIGFGADTESSVCFHNIGSVNFGHLDADDLQPVL